MRERVAYMGGTFDPVHAGHIGLARAVLDSGRVDRVVLAPAFAPPHKQERRVSAFVHRLNMLELAVAGVPGLGVSDWEARNRVTPSYTVEVMRRIQAAYPRREWFLLLGADSLMELHRWYRARELVENCVILTAPRPGVTVEPVRLKQEWGEEIGKKLAESVLDLPLFDFSSTEIRKKNKKDAVLPEIRAYIELCGLYRSAPEEGLN